MQTGRALVKGCLAGPGEFVGEHEAEGRSPNRGSRPGQQSPKRPGSRSGQRHPLGPLRHRSLNAIAPPGYRSQGRPRQTSSLTPARPQDHMSSPLLQMLNPTPAPPSPVQQPSTDGRPSRIPVAPTRSATAAGTLPQARGNRLPSAGRSANLTPENHSRGWHSRQTRAKGHSIPALCPVPAPDSGGDRQDLAV